MKTNISKIVDEEELREVLELQRSSFNEVAKLIGNYDLLPLRQTLSQIKEEFEKGIILKCLNDDYSIMGSVRGYIDNSNICHIGKLIVHPNFQNRGIGKALMHEIENQFASCRKFTLFTGKETPNTFHLYSKIGYQAVEEIVLGGVSMIVMEKLV